MTDRSMGVLQEADEERKRRSLEAKLKMAQREGEK